MPDLDIWCKKATSEIHQKWQAFWNYGFVFRQYMVSAVSFAMSCAMAGLFPTDCRSVQTYPETGGLEMRVRVFRSHGSKNHRCLVDLFATRRFSSHISVSETNGGFQWRGPIFFGVRRWKVKMFSLKAHHGTQNPMNFTISFVKFEYIIDMPSL